MLQAPATVPDYSQARQWLSLEGKFVLTEKRWKIRPVAVHAPTDATYFTTKRTKDTKKGVIYFFVFVSFVSFVVNS